jgi:hypothetical protein
MAIFFRSNRYILAGSGYHGIIIPEPACITAQHGAMIETFFGKSNGFLHFWIGIVILTPKQNPEPLLALYPLVGVGHYKNL